jgi:uncharacterized DUF497 family protein
MNFEWNNEKNLLNFQKHGFSFSDAAEIFNKPMVINLDDRKEYGENRYIGLGLLKGILAVIVYTQRKDTIRIISLRKANKREKAKFELATKNRLEASKINER